MLLVVEDDADEVFFIRRAFSRVAPELTLHVVGDGRQALAYLLGEGRFQDRIDFPLPDVVLLDLKIPYVRGTEIIRRIRAIPELRQIVVVVHTTSASPSDITEAYDAGANSYLVKPGLLEQREGLMRLINDYWIGANRFAHTPLFATKGRP